MPFLVALSGIISGVRDHSMTVRLDQQTRQRLSTSKLASACKTL
ncbi:Conserved protein of uncharacterised function%2C putative antitoxin MazE4 [Mycobacterium tuberculosis]|nr:Conserved protein of uncharacterised function%2C putative antitoxin MazE4 [Mycobacterium tuberculosis]